MIGPSHLVTVLSPDRGGDFLGGWAGLGFCGGAGGVSDVEVDIEGIRIAGCNTQGTSHTGSSSLVWRLFAYGSGCGNVVVRLRHVSPTLSLGYRPHDL